MESRISEHLPSFLRKMQKEALNKNTIDTFVSYYRKVAEHNSGLIYEKDIAPVEPEKITHLKDLQFYAQAGKKVLKHCVMIILNGGLGTSLGLTGPKSLIKVKNGKTFLELKLENARNAGTKAVLMNSFRTHEKTLEALKHMGIKNSSEIPLCFLQHKFPKIFQKTLAPAVWEKDPSLEWNPAGHGNIYQALFTSNMIHHLLDHGIRYAFISNCDNLGAVIDESLLGYFSQKGFPFLMEVTQRRPLDAKGGHLARNKEGKLLLREIAQCPQDELKAFQDITKYRFFNTNNLWIDLVFLKEYMSKYQNLRLPLILKPARLDPRNNKSPGIFQIETAMGSAISLFEGASAVEVPKARYIPVKGHNDLLAVCSDCFVLKENEGIIENPSRKDMAPIKISLDPEYFKNIDMFFERFRHGVPSLVQCESLTVRGNVFFEKDIKIRGRVRIENTQNTPAVISKGTVINYNMTI